MVNNTHWVVLEKGDKYTYKGVEYTWNQSTTTFEANGVIELPIACVTSKGNSSVGKWWIYYTAEESAGSIQIKKESSDTTITSGNNCYSLTGAKYGVYSDSSCKTSVGTLTITSTGWSNELTGLSAGTYYVKETTAPKGYALDTVVHSITVTSGNKSTATYKETPQTDPVGILLGKVDKETNQNKPQGSASLANAQFTVKFYAGSYDDGVDPAKSGVSPTRTWVMKTDANGQVRLSSDYKVSGDDFYLNADKNPTLPIGTITIQETKAPSGYLINNTVYVRRITSSGTASSVSTYNYPTIPEQINTFQLYKYFSTGTENKSLKGAVFTHTKPDGSTEELTTDANGKITLKGLEQGVHTFVEKSAPNGYQLNTNKITITVKADGSIQQDTTDLSKKGMSYDSSTYTMSVKDEQQNYDVQIIKKNEKGSVLEGAEFTFYSDAECTKTLQTLTTDKNGVLDFSSLQIGTTYYFKETKAPAGYQIPLQSDGSVKVWSVYVKADPSSNVFEVTVNGTTYSSSSTDTSQEVYVTEESNKKTVHLNVINYTSAKLPETGSSMNLSLIAAGAGLMLIGAFARKKSKQTQ
jgi:LPXTG-motif cell wall-anchored protein